MQVLVCLMVVAAVLGPVVTAAPFSTYKEMKQLACHLLRSHPVYTLLNLATDCEYKIALFGEDLCTMVFKREI